MSKVIKNGTVVTIECSFRAEATYDATGAADE
jgi:hypothetical protein